MTDLSVHIHLCWLIICIYVNSSLAFIGHISESGFHIRGVGGDIKVSHNFFKGSPSS